MPVLSANLVVPCPTIMSANSALTNTSVDQVIVVVTLEEVGPRTRGLKLKRQHTCLAADVEEIEDVEDMDELDEVEEVEEVDEVEERERSE